MAQILFYYDKHEYVVNGEKYDSVSEVLRFLSKEIYDDVNQYTLDNAAKRGTDVHSACEALYKYKKVECDPSIEGYVRAFLRFLNEHECDFTEIEKPIASKILKIAGTPDYVGMVDGKRCIVDLKSNSQIKKTLVKAQLNGYRTITNDIAGYERPEKLMCLQVKKDGKYSLYDCALDYTEFDACYKLHCALNRKHGRGIIE